jgi:hypothetical protein
VVPLRVKYYSIWLDPETVRYLDYDSDRACSAGTGYEGFAVTDHGYDLYRD